MSILTTVAPSKGSFFPTRSPWRSSSTFLIWSPSLKRSRIILWLSSNVSNQAKWVPIPGNLPFGLLRGFKSWAKNSMKYKTPMIPASTRGETSNATSSFLKCHGWTWSTHIKIQCFLDNKKRSFAFPVSFKGVEPGRPGYCMTAPVFFLVGMALDISAVWQARCQWLRDGTCAAVLWHDASTMTQGAKMNDLWIFVGIGKVLLMV